MKRALIMLAATTVVFAATPDPKLTPEDRAKAIRYLDESEKQYRELIASVTSDEQWKWHPAPGRWSVGEVAEHIVLAEQMLFASVEKAVAAPPNPDWYEQTKGKTEFLERAMGARKGKATAPESIVPSGTWTKAETLARYNDARAKTRRFIETTHVALLEHTAEHPFPVFKTLNAYQWFIYIPLHNTRHNGQMEDVMKAEGYPK